MGQIATVGIISKPHIPEAEEIVCSLLDWLDERGIQYRCDEDP